MFVFVYGTLKSGEPNNHWMSETENGAATFRWKGTTVEQYPLVIGSQYHIPFLLNLPGQGKNVQGEVYEIDEKKLAYLDILENCPILYIRRLEKIVVQAEEGPKTIEAWAYFLKSHKPELLSLPFLDNYSAYGPHGLLYVPHEDQLDDPIDI